MDSKLKSTLLPNRNGFRPGVADLKLLAAGEDSFAHMTRSQKVSKVGRTSPVESALRRVEGRLSLRRIALDCNGGSRLELLAGNALCLEPMRRRQLQHPGFTLTITYPYVNVEMAVRVTDFYAADRAREPYGFRDVELRRHRVVGKRRDHESEYRCQDR